MGRWGCGAVERQIEFVEPPASSFYCPRNVTEINKEFYFDLTRHLFQRETGIVEKNTPFKIFQQSLQKNLQKNMISCLSYIESIEGLDYNLKLIFAKNTALNGMCLFFNVQFVCVRMQKLQLQPHI